MILILIPLAGIVLGVILWGVMRGLGAFESLGGGGGGGGSWRADRSGWRDREPATWRERAQDAPRGCLLSIIAFCGVWVLGWLVVLVIGLSLLS